ncbi:TrmH family RNA methyltransferase [Microlunatus parietis]|uniref:TrmH family RNA methyltransferase n=1 Tax=Microlunatus parietis TaxID=682979 RepID=A0A7Y9LEX0_9ACTN|nr:TrmH family RNA methyltransferase [Microlunatus parietis]NYE74263.1 TrmH family RNA methyltransferase [Microlunatus parietis]
MIMNGPVSGMRADPVITSRTNKKVAELVRLRLPRHRARAGAFLIEGYRELSRAQSRVDLLDLYYCRALWSGRHEAALLARARAGGTRLVELAEEPFRRISHRDRPDGLIGVGRIFPAPLNGLPAQHGSLLLVVQGIEKPGNLGAMLRTACAAGVDGVIICDPATDPYGPGVVRASLGHLFTVPLAITDSGSALRWLQQRGITIFAGIPDAPDASWDADLTGAAAIAIGSEQRGLSSRWAEVAHPVRIPMSAGPAGGPDSLNAAVAAGVLLFEAARQRSGIAAPGSG